jgi:putative sigma-54 modulation protein
LNVSGHHEENTDSLRSYVSTNLEKRFYRISSTNVSLSVEKKRQKEKSTIHISGGEIYAVSEDKDLCAEIDQLANKLDRQLIKKKEKRLQTPS